MPPASFPIITAGSISGANPAVKPRWSPNTKAADTANAMFTTFPRRSISLTMPKVAMEFARLATKPAAAVSLIPNQLPTAVRGFFNSFVITNTRGKAPARTMAMAPTVSNPSVIGAIPGRMAYPVSASRIAAANPRVMIMTTPLPNNSNPRIIHFSAFQSPKAIRAPMTTMGTIFRSTIISGKPATKPPTSTPAGMVTMPQRMPRAILDLSCSSRIPMATGMVKTMVAPSILPVITPPNNAAWGSAVSSAAKAPPPISQARMVPANMAGSAPRN